MHIVQSPATSASQSAKGRTSTALTNHEQIQLHADAHNALAMALYYLRLPDANVPGASRKAVQALSALRRLDAGANQTKVVRLVPEGASELLTSVDAHAAQGGMQ